MKKLRVNLPGKEYDLLIEKGLISKTGDLIKDIYKGNKVAIISDETVASFYGNIVIESLKSSGFITKLITIPVGEESKSMNQLTRVYDELLEFKMTRSDLIIALGGGVTGDLTGYASSTLLRGIPFVQIPTSLLAQVDSSIGGKVAINLKQGKNLAGSFYHPKLVIIDPNCLETLAERFLHDGMAEVIKYGAIKDKELFALLMNIKDKEDLFGHIDDIIYRCCDIKRAVVEEDETDNGERMLLNFGHTLGHGIEKAFNFSTYTHGEAVALGMCAISKIGENLGLTTKGTFDAIKEIVLKYSLPAELQLEDSTSYKEALALDKKGAGENINLIMLNSIGDSYIYTIKKSEFEKILEN